MQNIVKPDSIGAQKQYQDPNEAVVAATGKYEDAAEKLPEAQKLPMLPQGADPSPFGNLSAPTGPGRGGV